MKKISRYLLLLAVSCIIVPCQTSLAQVCTPIFNDGLGVGSAFGFALPDYLTVRHFITCPPAVAPNGPVQEPALRLDYDEKPYFGQLSLVQLAGRNSMLSTEGDLILRASCQANDIILTTHSPDGAIRFATTPIQMGDCPAGVPGSPLGNEPLQPGSLNDLERMTILNNGNVGIGNNMPLALLHVGANIVVEPAGSGTSGNWGGIKYNDVWTGTTGKRIQSGAANGIVFIPSTPTNPAPNEVITSHGGVGMYTALAGAANTSISPASALTLRPENLQLWSASTKLIEYTFPTTQTPEGTLYIKDRVHIGQQVLGSTLVPPFAAQNLNGYNAFYKLAVNGSIVAKEIVVDARSWADFVFDPSYELIPLDNLEKTIQALGHLPDIPSAKDVETNGLPLGEFQAKLLQKIEELTLYVIQLKKENNSLTARLEQVENNH